MIGVPPTGATVPPKVDGAAPAFRGLAARALGRGPIL
jgi:hypothetical protein